MKEDTKVIHVGRDIELNNGSVNTPVFRTSTVLYPTLKSYLDADKGIPFFERDKSIRATDLSYGITGTPTTYTLQQSIAQIEEADHCIITSSGLMSITIALLAFLKSGDHLLMVDSSYGPTRRFCNKELKKLGIETTFYDPLIGEGIKDLIQENTKVIFTESPGSLTFEVQDIPAITKVARANNIVTILDNSWSTPLFFKAFDHGIDVTIHAGTKYFSGHSDLLFGTISCMEKHIDTIFSTFRNYGVHTSPGDCYLANRGIKTLSVRVERHQKSALKVAKWLKDHELVERVHHVALPDCPGHEIWKRDFKGSTGLFSFVLKENYSLEQLSKFVDNLELFGIGASWGGCESLILPFDPKTVRSAIKWPYKGSCVRLYVGLEDVNDLINDLEKGLERLK